MRAKKREESQEHAHHFGQVGSHWRSLPGLFYGMVGTLGWLHMEWLLQWAAKSAGRPVLCFPGLSHRSVLDYQAICSGEECGSHCEFFSALFPSSKLSISCLSWFQYLWNMLFSFCCYPNSDYHCFCQSPQTFLFWRQGISKLSRLSLNLLCIPGRLWTSSPLVWASLLARSQACATTFSATLPWFFNFICLCFVWTLAI